MNCFTLQQKSSDLLDGTLPESIKQEAEDHLEGCKECSDRYKHYRLILSSIASQPRAALPAAIKKSPLSNPLIPRGQASKIAINRWEHVPWIIRTLIEGVSIVGIILIGISSAPKLRALYEKNIEKNLNDFKESTHIAEPIVENADIAVPPLQDKVASNPTAGNDDLAGEDESDASDNVKVGRSQLWRFTLKTVSPDELRPQVVKTLTELGVPNTTHGLGGMQVPGGIEFDMILPQTLVPNIKHALQKLAPPPLNDKDQHNPKPGSETFTWYKVKSKRNLPTGTSQVVIWLSQLN